MCEALPAVHKNSSPETAQKAAGVYAGGFLR